MCFVNLSKGIGFFREKTDGPTHILIYGDYIRRQILLVEKIFYFQSCKYQNFTLATISIRLAILLQSLGAELKGCFITKSGVVLIIIRECKNSLS